LTAARSPKCEPAEGGSAGDARRPASPPALVGDPHTLEYGSVNRLKADIHCFSEERGLSCWSPESEHGFFVSRSVFAVF
jgi:hypothetical protein